MSGEWSATVRGPGSGPMFSGGDGAAHPACPVCRGIQPTTIARCVFVADAIGHRPDCTYSAPAVSNGGLHRLTDEMITFFWPDIDTPDGRDQIRRQFDSLMAAASASPSEQRVKIAALIADRLAVRSMVSDLLDAIHAASLDAKGWAASKRAEAWLAENGGV